jgi:hypothetical protein
MTIFHRHVCFARRGQHGLYRRPDNRNEDIQCFLGYVGTQCAPEMSMFILFIRMKISVERTPVSCAGYIFKKRKLRLLYFFLENRENVMTPFFPTLRIYCATETVVYFNASHNIICFNYFFILSHLLTSLLTLSPLFFCGSPRDLSR